MLISECLKTSFRLSRDLKGTKKVKEYRQVTQDQEIKRDKKQLMETNDWEKIKEEEGWEKLYKYNKEEYVKKQVAEQTMQMIDRAEEIKDIDIDIDTLNNWKRFFFIVFEQEGDSEFDEDYFKSIIDEIESQNGYVVQDQDKGDA